MHVRLSAIRGTPIVDDGSQSVVGYVHDILIHPDSARIEGFFVMGLLQDVPGELFLLSHDILSWGTTVHLRSSDRLCQPSDLIRLRPLLEDVRTVLGQPVRVRGSNRSLGVCRDVQFDTRHCRVEWIFPYRCFVLQQRPVAVTEIEEITPDAIWITDPLRCMKEEVVPSRVQQEAASLREQPLVVRS